MPALSVAVLFTVTLAGIFIATPVLVSLGVGPVQFDGPEASTVPQSVPNFLAGLVLLALCSYLVTLVAGADAAITRSLLFAGGRRNGCAPSSPRSRRPVPG